LLIAEKTSKVIHICPHDANIQRINPWSCAICPSVLGSKGGAVSGERITQVPPMWAEFAVGCHHYSIELEQGGLEIACERG